MGAWGYKPFENDSALDWISNNITPRVEKGLRSNEPQEVRVAAAVITDFLGKHELGPKTVDMAIAALEKLLEDERWIASWNEPAEIMKAIKSQISRLKRLEDPMNR